MDRAYEVEISSESCICNAYSLNLHDWNAYLAYSFCINRINDLCADKIVTKMWGKMFNVAISLVMRSELLHKWSIFLRLTPHIKVLCLRQRKLKIWQFSSKENTSIRSLEVPNSQRSNFLKTQRSDDSLHMVCPHIKATVSIKYLAS